ncbi:MAG: hypothetical protein ACYC0J_07050, partial [Gammaproteobacteria bacterium]
MPSGRKNSKKSEPKNATIGGIFPYSSADDEAEPSNPSSSIEATSSFTASSNPSSDDDTSKSSAPESHISSHSMSSAAAMRVSPSTPVQTKKASAAYTSRSHAASSSLTIRLPDNILDLNHFARLTLTVTDDFGVKRSFKAKSFATSAQSSTKGASRSSGLTPSSSYQAPPRNRRLHETDTDVEMSATPSSSYSILKTASEPTYSSSDEENEKIHLDSDSDSSDHENDQLDDHSDQGPTSTPSVDLEEMDEDGDIFHD